jgi:hypothetical protein
MLLGVLLIVLAACGGGGPGSSVAESTGGEPSTAASASEPAASTAETPDDGGPAPTSIEELEDELVPPNSTQISRTETPQGVLVAYESTDIVPDLKAYYARKIADLGMTVITTNEAANTWAIAFGTDETGTGLGGTIAVQNAGDVSNVVVTLAEAG